MLDSRDAPVVEIGVLTPQGEFAMSTITIDIDRLKADIAAKRRELEQLEAVEKAASTYAVNSNGETENHVEREDQPQPVTNEFRGMTLFAAAEVVLKRAGGPLKTADIGIAVVAGGLGSGDRKIFMNSIYAAMRRKQETFRLLRPGTWELIGT
jgi:hypothetical protein